MNYYALERKMQEVEMMESFAAWPWLPWHAPQGDLSLP